MVGSGQGVVRIEIVPWLTETFGQRGSSRLFLDEKIAKEMSLFDFLSSMSEKYPAVGKAIVDIQARRLHEHVNIVCNDTMLSPGTALDEPIKGGDNVIFLPAYVGG